jgi:hypothetical protein
MADVVDTAYDRLQLAADEGTARKILETYSTGVLRAVADLNHLEATGGKPVLITRLLQDRFPLPLGQDVERLRELGRQHGREGRRQPELAVHSAYVAGWDEGMAEPELSEPDPYGLQDAAAADMAADVANLAAATDSLSLALLEQDNASLRMLLAVHLTFAEVTIRRTGLTPAARVDALRRHLRSVMADLGIPPLEPSSAEGVFSEEDLHEILEWRATQV